jgi:glycosyltransferase involved in cell wall biosynthesis
LPQVSVIIPTYNSARYLVEALESVLAQTFRDVEVLVIDDGSTDETPEIMKRYGEPVRYLRQENAGVAAARNRGIGESSGKYIAFLDADDTWYPQKLERQMAALANGTGYRACYSTFLEVKADLTPIGVRRIKRQGSTIEDLLLRGNVVGSICTVVAERSLFDTVGGFDPDLSQCADWDMWVRLAAQTEFIYLDEPLVTYRQHGMNMSRNAPLLETDSLRVLEKGFAMPGLLASLQRQRRRAYGRNYMVLAGTYFHAGMRLDFARCAIKSLTLDHRQLRRLLMFPARVFAKRMETNL